MSEKFGSGDYGGQIGNRLPPHNSQLKHIFRQAEGHLADTARNRQAVLELINDPANEVATDARGNGWYSRLNSDGSQLWAVVRGGVLQNAGVNKPPRDWDSITGFNRNPAKRR